MGKFFLYNGKYLKVSFHSSYHIKRGNETMAKSINGKELGKGIRQRKDGRYEARATINGITVSLYNTDLSLLKKEFEAWKQQVSMNADMKRQQITLNEWFEEWFEKYKIPSIKPTSVFPMKSKYYNTFGKQIGHMKVVDIRNIDIQEVLNEMQSEGKAASSMKDALGRVRDCLESAKNNRIIEQNPCFDIFVPWESRHAERRFLTMDEQRTFLRAVEHNWYKEMFYVMFLTGMRVGEVGGLKWSDIDFEQECIHINHSLSCNYEKGIKKMLLTTPKTYNSYRKIPFMGEVKEMLLAQKAKQDRLRKMLGDRYRCSGDYADLVFVTSMGSPVLRYHAEKECRKVVESINEAEAYVSVKEQRKPVPFEPVHPHAIRHTFCSRCFEKDINPKVVQAWMGHSNYSTTMDIYTHVTGKKFDEEVLKFGSAM